MTQHDLTRGPIRPHLIRIGIPAAMGMVFNTLYNLTDNWFAGHISDTALAGLSVASIVFALFTALVSGIQNGTTALVAIAIGQGTGIKAWLKNSNGIAWTLSLLIVGLGLWVAPDLLRLLTEDSSVFDAAWDYTSVVLLANVAFALTHVAAGGLMAFGITQVYRNVLIAGFFVNIVLNYLFVVVWNMGPSGLAWSTVIIKFGGLIYLYASLKKHSGVSVSCAVDWPHWRGLLAQMVPASLNMLTVIVGGFIIIFFIAHFGDEAVAGYSVGVRIEQLLLLPAMGLNAAVMAVVGQSYGRGVTTRVRATYVEALKLGAYLSLLVVPLMVLAAPWLLSQFTQNEHIIAVGSLYLRTDAWAFYGYMVLFCSVAVLQAIKKPLFPLLIGVLRQMVLPGLAFYVLIHGFNQQLPALFWSIVAIVLASALLTVWFTLRKIHDFEEK